MLRGRRAEFLRDVQTLEDTLNRWGSEAGLMPRMGTEHYIVARWLLAAGELDRARAIFERVQHLNHPLERPSFRIQREPIGGYLAWARGDHATAANEFAAALQRVGPGLEILGQASELRLRLAWVRLREGNPHAAAAALLPLFTRHADDADIAGVLIPGLEILGELARGRWGDALGSAPRNTLQRWADIAAALRGAAAAPAPQSGPPARKLPGGLSERELEVLQRMAAGDSNKLIARAFDLSPHTVKRHVANILDKLALSSRGQAAAWYRDHA
jgi:LuxR family maltose regulon positive regulatory protein